jgi:hypothetical protein
MHYENNKKTLLITILIHKIVKNRSNGPAKNAETIKI